MTIRVAPDLTVVHSRLIDANPQTATFNDAPLLAGRTFLDPINTIYVTVVVAPARRCRCLGPVWSGRDAAQRASRSDPRLQIPTVRSTSPGHSASDDTLRHRLRDPAWWRTDCHDDRHELRRLRAGPGHDPFLLRACARPLERRAHLVRSMSTCPTRLRPRPRRGCSQASSAPTSVALEWGAAADNVGVVGYSVWRDGSEIATTTGTTYRDESALGGGAGTLRGSCRGCCRQLERRRRMPPSNTSDSSPPLFVGPLVLDTDSAAVTLSWGSGADAFGVAGYSIERNGTCIADVTLTGWIDTPWLLLLPTNTKSSLLDPSGNRSSPITKFDLCSGRDRAQRAELVDRGTSMTTGQRQSDGRRRATTSALTATWYPSTERSSPRLTELELASVVVEQGRTYAFEVHAVDAAGNVGAAGGADLIVPT